MGFWYFRLLYGFFFMCLFPTRSFGGGFLCLVFLAYIFPLRRQFTPGERLREGKGAGREEKGVSAFGFLVSNVSVTSSISF